MDMQKLIDICSGAISINQNQVQINNPELLKREAIDALVKEAVFGDEETKNWAKWLIRSIALSLDIYPASINEVYSAKGRGEVSGFTVPAINIRGLTYDMARAVFRAAKKCNAGLFIFEIAKSEMGYTHQRPSEYSSMILAAAIKEMFTGPVFIQGDHFQFNLNSFKKDPDKETNLLKEITLEAMEAGFYNIDIDASTLVDLSKTHLKEQQFLNYSKTAEITALIRKNQPEGITISVGGEIGEVGGRNSTIEDYEAFMDGYLESLEKHGKDLKGISKISVQTGTSHGGVVLPDGSIAQVKLDFGVLENITKVAKEKYKMAGTVQHGASTLPEELFDKFPKTGAVEIHLATGFQNILFDHENFPESLKNSIYKWLEQNYASEKKPGMTDEQFMYKTRKQAWGQFKKDIWSIAPEAKVNICKTLEDKFSFYFDKLNIKDTLKIRDKYIKPVKFVPSTPDKAIKTNANFSGPVSANED